MRKFLPAFAFGLAVFAIFGLSAIFVNLGDAAFVADRLTPAHIWYTLASYTNPFNDSIKNRLLAIQMTIYDRTAPNNEETQTPRAIALAPTNSHVLGIASCIPVLMYHYIRVNPWPTDTVGFGLSTPPYAFAQQMDYLQSRGYHTIGLSQLEEQIVATSQKETAGKEPPYAHVVKAPILPTNPIIITLDDGYEDAYSAGYPILKERGMKAVEFVITGFVGLPNYLTWDEIWQMEQSGVFDMESHTVHHYALAGDWISTNLLDSELVDSQIDLETHLHKLVKWIAYPYGNVNDKVAKETQKYYYAAFGTNFGSYQATELDKRYTLPRIRVGGGVDGAWIEQQIQQAQSQCVQEKL